MLSTSRRVKAIYSAIASPNRLEILKILNSRGPLTYSELKTLAGFKSKKESGKFAYHLRKLVRQMLIILNRSERRYNLTNLGRLILTLSRKIEEQSLIESGKIYVRTSRQTIEEFKSEKILQSLVREAGMPIEEAQRITGEVENRLSKFQTGYLTAPLIREIVNSVLIEQGSEQHRQKLTRLGLPVYDVTQMISNMGKSWGGIEALFSATAQRVFGEYLLLISISKDLADAHLSGDLNLSNIGTWGLIPDTVFLDLSRFPLKQLDFGGKLPFVPRAAGGKNPSDLLLTLSRLLSILSSEVSDEIVLLNLLPALGEYYSAKNAGELSKEILNFLQTTGTVMRNLHGDLSLTLHLGQSDGAKGLESVHQELMRHLLSAYADYSAAVPRCNIKIVLEAGREGLDDDVLKTIGAINSSGGAIAITAPSNIVSFKGVRASSPGEPIDSDVMTILHGVAINVPRLAYESGGDEGYFRSRLASMIQAAVSALVTRKELIGKVLTGGLLPALYNNLRVGENNLNNLTINLAGFQDALATLLKSRANIVAEGEKILESASKYAASRRIEGGDNIHVGILQDGSSNRFYELDTERFGKSVTSNILTTESYSSTPIIPADSVADELDSWSGWAKKLRGGFSVAVEAPSFDVKLLKEIMARLGAAGHVRLRRGAYFCMSCGAKSSVKLESCSSCKKRDVRLYFTDS